MRLFIVANIQKADGRPALDRVLEHVRQRVDVIGLDTDRDWNLATLEADAVLVLGGDGTLLATARRLRGKPIPLMGVNFGRLGFLAPFTPDEFLECFEAFLAGKLPLGRRLVLDTSVIPAATPCDPADKREVSSKRRFASTALNDAVITAGPPFHLIELEVGMDDEQRIRYSGDGVIVSTPSGSTAYNISAGGPILSPTVPAFCLTPICPHSLSFRPVVIPATSTVEITALRVNEGTTFFCDGQASTRLHEGDRVVVRRSPHDVLLVENPRNQQWRGLADKLHWAVSPRYQGS